jgi:hypothetical protein
MQVVRGNAMSAIVNITKNACTAVVSLIQAPRILGTIEVASTRRRRQKAVVADSESRFLAIKKFSCTTASRLIAARQTRFFAGIAAADSPRDSGPRNASRLVRMVNADRNASDVTPRR